MSIDTERLVIVNSVGGARARVSISQAYGFCVSECRRVCTRESRCACSRCKVREQYTASAHKTNHSNLSRTEIASEPPSRFESLIMMLACASIYLRVSRYNS